MKQSVTTSLLILAALFFGSPPALAADTMTADNTRVEIDLSKVLPCPPQSDIAADAAITCAQNPALERQDYQAVLDAQKNASESAKTQAIADAARPSVTQFSRALWEGMAAPSCHIPPELVAAKDDKALAEKLPATVALIHAMTSESIRIGSAAKNFYNRKRPYQTTIEGLPPITPLVKTDNLKKSPSYPSGHTSFAFEVAMVYANLVPEAQEVIYARARQYGHNREIVGVHFPTDVHQGAISGSLIAAAFLQTDAFRKKLEAARPELRKALCY
jgi:hypothetical protein